MQVFDTETNRNFLSSFGVEPDLAIIYINQKLEGENRSLTEVKEKGLQDSGYHRILDFLNLNPIYSLDDSTLDQDDVFNLLCILKYLSS